MTETEELIERLRAPLGDIDYLPIGIARTAMRHMDGLMLEAAAALQAAEAQVQRLTASLAGETEACALVADAEEERTTTIALASLNLGSRESYAAQANTARYLAAAIRSRKEKQ